MAASESFTFGIALIPRACAQNWPLVEALIDLTLTSVRAQTDTNFQTIIAGHERPRTAVGDPRITFLQADWPVQEPGPNNVDSWRKKYAINQLVLDRGGGLLMFLDADDWTDVGLVEAARAVIGPDQIGGLIETGFVTDFQSLRAARLPHPLVFDGDFHRICGSSTVARLRPDSADPLRRNPWAVLDSHHQWVEVAQKHGAELARLPVSGSYVVNTSENHSEVHGPYTAWRRTFAQRVNLDGNALDDGIAARFGLSVEQIRAASERFFPQADRRCRSPRPTIRMPRAGPAPGTATSQHGVGEGPELGSEHTGRRIVLVGTMRNEGPYILEWAAYHLAVGFTDIVICTNDCVDESPLLLERLQELGRVNHLANEVGPGEEAQLLAYRRAEELRLVRDADWLMVLDADEFLNIHVGAGTVPDLLDAVPEATAFLLNWRMFGNSGRLRRPRETQDRKIM